MLWGHRRRNLKVSALSFPFLDVEELREESLVLPPCKYRKNKLQVSLAQCFLFQLSICLKIECKYGTLISHSKLFTVCLWECSTVCTLLLHCEQWLRELKSINLCRFCQVCGIPKLCCMDACGPVWLDIRCLPKLVSLPSPGERKYNERLKGRDKDRERSVTSYHPGQNKPDLGK